MSDEPIEHGLIALGVLIWKGELSQVKHRKTARHGGRYE
jgi:hypothetical protein